MSDNNLKDWLTQHQITEIECLVPDMTGNARGKITPADVVIKNTEMKLPESILIQTVSGEWTEEHDDLVDPKDGDMICQPDPSTVRMVPWWDKEPTAQVIYDCFEADGVTPHRYTPRNVLKRVLKMYEDLGLRPVVAPEVEFYLVKKNANPNDELAPPVGRSGRPESARQSYSIDALNDFDPLFEEMYDFCEAQNLDVDTMIHESGRCQMEINFEHGDAMDLADQVFFFKRTLREVAMRHGVYATFMAKPMEHEPGSAMHIHQSLIDIKTGDNVFSDGEGGYTETFMNYLGGMQKYVPAAMTFYAPNVNSYRRFAPDIAAPINLKWGYDNRTTGLRVPLGPPAAARIENRFPGSDANPYLAIAATLACGLLGMREKATPTEPYEGCAFNEGIELPRTLVEAGALLEDCEPLKEVIGKPFATAYAAVKRAEYEEFAKVVSSWEREFLLLTV